MKSKRTAFAPLLLTLLLTAALAAPAHAIRFIAELDAAQEVLPSTSTATGFATLTLDSASTRLEMELQLTGLDLDGNQTPGDSNDDVVGLHIHRGVAGVNGPVVFGLINPNSDTNGDLVINALAGTLFSAWDESIEGNGTTLGAELANLLSDGLYFNVHTTQFTSGAIRGQIVLVPEPKVLWLLGLGFAALGLGNHLRRRREARSAAAHQ